MSTDILLILGVMIGVMTMYAVNMLNGYLMMNRKWEWACFIIVAGACVIVATKVVIMVDK